MNITFLIGNGFDLNLGLKTRYLDFINDYRRINSWDSKAARTIKELFNDDINLWSDAEIAFGKLTKDFLRNNYNAEYFCDCHEVFCINLAAYLDKQIDYFNDLTPFPIIADRFPQALLNYKDGFREVEKNELIKAEKYFGGGFTFNFINFNYTSTLDTCISVTKKNTNVLGARNYAGGSIANRFGQNMHIHGTTKKDMVLGVNDISQIAAPSLFDGYDDEYINEVIKPLTNNANGENNDKKGLDLLSSSDMIYIYGMSIGATDALWWHRICELLLNNKHLHVIIHRFDAPPENLIMRRYNLFVKNSREEFTSYFECDDIQKADIQKRIHIDRTNIFSELTNIVQMDTAPSAKAKAKSIS